MRISDWRSDVCSSDLRVVTAGSGQKALRLIEGERFDVILSDVRMPELDGPSLYATLERTAPDLLKRTCFISGDTLSPSARVFLQRVPRPLIEKPFTLAAVPALVGRVRTATRQPGVARRARGTAQCEGGDKRHAGGEAP